MNEQIAAYKVVSTQDTMAYDAQRGMIRHKRVNMRFADGTTTYVEVPHTPDWAAVAYRAMQEMYTQHYEVMGIEGPPIVKGR